MTKREKIEYKFEEMMDDIGYKQYHIICNYIDLTVGEALADQKQSILKAIMEEGCISSDLRDPNETYFSLSVIKEVLSK